jgi:aryl-alcohol dehydrogenase-like predicted oxidoreductase
MTMTGFYGGFDRSRVDDEAEKTLRAALAVGINFLDTAWIYQAPLLCRWSTHI